MDSSMISKIQKAKRYAEELDRITFENFQVQFRGEHGTYQVAYDINAGWHCECNYFASRGLCSHTMAMERILNNMVERAQPKTSEVEV